WVSTLEETTVGDGVGYVVRDETRSTDKSRIVFVTPGIALRWLAMYPHLDMFSTIIIDEFHERGWQVDLILAVLAKRRRSDLIVMSATMDPKPLIEFLQAIHVGAQGRRFPVDISYLPSDAIQPDRRGLGDRVKQALEGIETSGDVLVFLPGKGEINEVDRALSETLRERFEVFQLHSGLRIEEQRAVFRATQLAKLILATNIAETSVTLPGVTLVIDSGLVRRTEYFQGRGFLGMVPIAQDAADQRAGRAGRVQAGRCVRLWSKSARLEAQTHAEVLRDGLTPLVLAVLEMGECPYSLPFLSTPKHYAIDSALEDLRDLEAVSAEGELTDTGREVARLPLDPHLGRLLVQSKINHCAPLMVITVAILGLSPPPRLLVNEERVADDPAHEGCDIWRILSAYLMQSEGLRLSSFDRQRIKQTSKRIGLAVGVEPAQTLSAAARNTLAKTAAMADRRFVFVKRTRRKRIFWTNGVSEAELSRNTALSRCVEKGERVPDAVVALEVFALSVSQRRRTLQLNWLMPIAPKLIDDEIHGDEHLTDVRIGEGGLEGLFSREHGGRILGTQWRLVKYSDLRETLIFGFLHCQLWQNQIEQLREELSVRARHAFLSGTSLLEHFRGLEAYLTHWFNGIGIDECADLLLIEPEDVLPPPLETYEREMVLRKLPDEVVIGSKPATITYELDKRLAILHMDKRSVKAPINPRFLPAVEGFAVAVQDGTRKRMLRK
ncbi:MAG: helicase-related protein, partial [Bradymonadia bacterium]